MADIKAKHEKAAERAEILENMEEDERAVYRKRKTYVSIPHEWKDFIIDSDGDEAKELFLAIITYDETGEVPVFKDGLNKRVFTGFMKRTLDQNFNDWCVTCHQAKNNGEKGPKAKAIIRRVTELFKAKYKADVFDNVKVADLLKNIDNLQSVLAGHTVMELNTLQADILNFRKQAEEEYQNERK